MVRSATNWSWVGTASGLLFVGAQFAGFGAGAAARGFERITLDSPPAEVARAVEAPVPTAVWVAGYVEVFAYLAFLVFAACLAAHLRGDRASRTWASTTVLAAGVLVVATSMLGYATEGAAYLRAGDGADPAVAGALLDVANVAFVLVWAALAVLLLAAAASRELPRGLGIAAAVLGVVFLVGFAAPSLPVGEIADLALWIWIIAVSVALAVQRPHRRSDATPAVDVR